MLLLELLILIVSSLLDILSPQQHLQSLLISASLDPPQKIRLSSSGLLLLPSPIHMILQLDAVLEIALLEQELVLIWPIYQFVSNAIPSLDLSTVPPIHHASASLDSIKPMSPLNASHVLPFTVQHVILLTLLFAIFALLVPLLAILLKPVLVELATLSMEPHV